MRVDSHPRTFVWLLTACTSLLNSVFHSYLFLLEVVTDTSATEALQRTPFQSGYGDDPKTPDKKFRGAWERG